MNLDVYLIILQNYGLGILILSILIVTLSSYLTRWMINRDLEKHRRKTEEDLVIRRMSFETEYEIYKALWEKISSLRFGIMNLFPLPTQPPLNDLWEPIKKEKYDILRQSIDKFVEAAFTDQPFYSPEVYSKSEEITKWAKIELENFDKVQPKHAENFNKDGLKKLMDLYALCNDLNNSIRARIWRK
ncbi:MAG: hypothetical protein KAV87_17270 [Desulfobacteraceae bacterium]|nr:hypothetical protein [Desulfobacteraceae bacterium]